jgi:hypothetical protein
MSSRLLPDKSKNKHTCVYCKLPNNFYRKGICSKFWICAHAILPLRLIFIVRCVFQCVSKYHIQLLIEVMGSMGFESIRHMGTVILINIGMEGGFSDRYVASPNHPRATSVSLYPFILTWINGADS